MTQALTALFCVIVTLVAVALLVRVFGVTRKARTTRGLRVLETTSLGGGRQIHLVEVAGERLLLGSTENVVNTLRRVPRREASPAEPSAGGVKARVPRQRRGQRPWLRLLVLALVLGCQCWQSDVPTASRYGLLSARPAEPASARHADCSRIAPWMNG